MISTGVLYRQQLAIWDKIPELRGLSSWISLAFRPVSDSRIQDGYNRGALSRNRDTRSLHSS
jgi:hypothetical protein